MNKNKTLSARLVLLMTLCLPAFALAQNSHEDLLALFADWRAFERPPLRDW